MMVDRLVPHSVDPMDQPKAGYSDIPSAASKADSMEHSMVPMWASTKAAHWEPTLVDTWALRMAAQTVDYSAALTAGHSADSKVSKMACLPVAAMDDSLEHSTADSTAYCSDYSKAAMKAVPKAC